MKPDSLHQYSELFYRYQREGSLRSARATIPVVREALNVHSVLDVGCGAGAWLAAYNELGVDDFQGVDGDYVNRKVLLIPERRFRPQDITQPFDLGRRFDLVQCLEVAEHVQPGASEVLVDNIVRHGRQVLFSAAVPGQGGEDHINEQPLDYWRSLFAQRGYRLFDFVRPKIARDPAIESWYRYNIMFFAHDDSIAGLAPSIVGTRVADRAPIADLAPVGYRLRKGVLRALPTSAVTLLAKWKHRRTVKALAAGRA